MTSRSQVATHRRSDGARLAHFIDQLSSGNSPRNAKGHLVLRANTLDHLKCNVISWYESGAFEGTNGYTCNNWGSVIGSLPVSSVEKRIKQTAYARIRGNLYKGSAALGVTAAAYKQSADMIRSNSEIITRQAEFIADAHSAKRLSKRVAGKYLEIIFGWQPLLSDIHASATSVVQMADSLDFVRGVGREPIARTIRNVRPGWNDETIWYNAAARCTSAYQVAISNPNRWLLERAGLHNPAAVAWDVVPFSFLVNMFVNTGNLVNSITDFAGLSFSNGSTTIRWDVNRTVKRTETYPRVGSTGQEDLLVYKRRTLGGPSYPKQLTFKLPEVNWETAAMATSLMVQQAVPVLKLLKRFRSSF